MMLSQLGCVSLTKVMYSTTVNIKISLAMSSIDFQNILVEYLKMRV